MIVRKHFSSRELILFFYHPPCGVVSWFRHFQLLSRDGWFWYCIRGIFMCKEEGHVIPFLICISFVVKILTVGQSCVYISIIPHFHHGHSFNPRYLRPSPILRSHSENLTINNAYAFYKSFDFHIKFQKLLRGISREGCELPNCIRVLSELCRFWTVEFMGA